MLFTVPSVAMKSGKNPPRMAACAAERPKCAWASAAEGIKDFTWLDKALAAKDYEILDELSRPGV